MKSTNRLKPRAGRAVKAAGALNANHPDYFAQLAEISTSTVEHCTVAEFLNRCRVRNPDDIIRFGDKARKLADSLLLAWVTTTNDSLGVLRILPVPLMKYLYAQMAGQFGWPPMVAELEDRGDRFSDRIAWQLSKSNLSPRRANDHSGKRADTFFRASFASRLILSLVVSAPIASHNHRKII
jgi:hypothetical protein